MKTYKNKSSNQIMRKAVLKNIRKSKNLNHFSMEKVNILKGLGKKEKQLKVILKIAMII